MRQPRRKTAERTGATANRPAEMEDDQSFEVGPVLDLQSGNKVDKKAVLADKLDGLVAGTSEITTELVGKNDSYTRGFSQSNISSSQDGDNAAPGSDYGNPGTQTKRARWRPPSRYSVDAAAELSAAWDTGSGDYLDIYLQEDEEGVYASDKDGIDALFNCMLNHLADVLEYRLQSRWPSQRGTDQRSS